MVVRYNKNYLNKTASSQSLINSKAIIRLTPENRQFLQQLGLKLKDDYIERRRKGSF